MAARALGATPGPGEPGRAAEDGRAGAVGVESEKNVGRSFARPFDTRGKRCKARHSHAGQLRREDKQANG